LVKNRQKKRSGTSIDGGRFALVGFTQQILGSAAAFIGCMSRGDGVHDSESDAIFEIEIDGQDESTTSGTPHGGRSRVLRQYKVSSTNRKICMPDAKDIVRALRRSYSTAKKRKEIETYFELCTNQEMSSPAASFLDDSNVRVVEHDPNQAREELREYAARFGVMGNEELQRGIDLVMGRFFGIASSTGSHQITKAEFDRALTGFPNPCSIAIPELCARRRRDLDEQEVRLRLDEIVLTPREKIREVIERWTNESLIVFIGDGGCGKTTALMQVLKERSPHIPACLLLPSETAPRSIAGLVAEWRGALQPTASDEDALKRLRYANRTNQPPLLILGLDGIDEIPDGSEWYWNARQLVNLFWCLHIEHTRGAAEPPPARLLVTCRRADQITNLLTPPTGIDYAPPGISPDFINITEFSRPELESLVQESSTIHPEVRQRIMDKVGEIPGQEDGMIHPSAQRLTSDLVQPTWIELIRRPIIWRFFTIRPREQQLSLLRGEGTALPAAEAAIAHGYIEWFLKRTHQRHRLSRDVVRDALVAAARTFAPSAGPHSVDNWRVALSGVGLGGREPQILQRESASVGLIYEIPHPVAANDFWQWRHEFLWNYLRTGATEPHG
jgi:GTPase SAR1 family protein